MSGNSRNNKNSSKNRPPPSVDELMKALVAKDDENAVTAFSRGLFYIDAPHFVTSYQASKAEGRPIQFEQAGAMAGLCYAHMDELRVQWLVYANIMDRASEPYDDFIVFLADTLELPKFKQYYRSFLVFQRMNPLEQEKYYEGMLAEKAKYPKDHEHKEAESRKVAEELERYDAFVAAEAKRSEGGAGPKRKTRRSRR